METPQIGWVGTGNGKTGLSAFLQHHLVGTGTHAFIIGYNQGSNGDIPSVFESDMRVSYDLWSNYLKDTTYDMWIYEVIGATEQEIEWSLNYCIGYLLGDSYGYAEWLWFPYRMFCQKILRQDVRKQSNWFKKWAVKGCICTELWWWYIWGITGGIVVKPQWTKLRGIIAQWNPDVLTANDVLHIQQDNPDLFRLKLQRVDGVVTMF